MCLEQYVSMLPDAQTVLNRSEAAFAAMRALGSAAGLPDDLLYGNASHASMWHACSIIEHMRWCTALAQACVQLPEFRDSPAAVWGDELVIAAIYHDIGKVVAPQLTSGGWKFHEHGPAGAEFLSQHSLVSPRIAEAISHHGAYRKQPYPANIDVLVIYLDVCDELAKWSELRFPPAGGEKQQRNRCANLDKAIAAGVPENLVCQLKELSDCIADGIGLICDERTEQ